MNMQGDDYRPPRDHPRSAGTAGPGAAVDAARPQRRAGKKTGASGRRDGDVRYRFVLDLSGLDQA